MNARNLFSRGLRVLGVMALAGGVAACASNNKIDFGTHHDLAVGGTDDLGVGEDLAAPDDAAASTDGSSGCTQVATWPTTEVEAGFDTSYGDTYLFSAQIAGSTINLLDIGDYHLAKPETFPRSVSFSSADTEQNCDLCVNICAGYDQTTGACTTNLFVQSGSLTVDQADSDPNMGRFKVSGTNLKLVEWQDPSATDGGIVGDKPVPNGQCWEIGSLSFDQPWGDTDGGMTDDGGTTTVDGGACHPVVNEVLPATSASAAEEFVEIYNPCTAAIDLTGWKLVYRSATNVKPGDAADDSTTLVTFPSASLSGGAAISTIAAGQYLTYWNSGYGTAGTNKDGNLSGSSSGALGGTAGSVALRDAAGTLIDSMGYGATTGNAFIETATFPALTTAMKGSSISRTPNGTDNNDNSKDFQVTATPTPKAANP
ncbi:MAG: lamin tail domain-containing protein [Polyangia bacterium]